ncbi:MAG: helix-turn-helix domain-containing protein [Desulfobacteraceae bacterium]|nr:helix-turn-helix domain-containing protein [Desulfobacteraceae bacterium]
MVTENLTMTIPEVAKALGISRGTAYSLARQGQLPIPVIKLGPKRMVVSRHALERLLSGDDGAAQGGETQSL